MAAKKRAKYGKKSSASFWQKPNNTTSTNARSTTTIGTGLSIEGGTIKGDGHVRIDGYFVGDIEITGDVSVGETGAVYGDIRANCATISGNSKGSISTAEKIRLTSSAVVEGTLTSGAIVIDERAVFNGTCKMETDVQLPDTNLVKV